MTTKTELTEMSDRSLLELRERINGVLARREVERSVEKPRFFPRTPIATRILQQVALDHGLTVETMVLPIRTQRFKFARYDAISRLRAETLPNGKPRFSYIHAAALVGLTDHSTACHAVKRWAAFQANNDAKREAEAA